MSELLTELGLVVTQSMTWIVSVCDTIVSEPLLLLTVGFLCIGAAIGLFGRLLSRG